MLKNNEKILILNIMYWMIDKNESDTLCGAFDRSITFIKDFEKMYHSYRLTNELVIKNKIINRIDVLNIQQVLYNMKNAVYMTTAIPELGYKKILGMFYININKGNYTIWWHISHKHKRLKHIKRVIKRLSKNES